MRRVVRSIASCFFILGFWSNAAAADIPWEKRSGYNGSGIYGWTYSYEIGYFSKVLMIDLDISLYGEDPGQILKSRWESGIESIWSTDRFSTPFRLNVDFTDVQYDQSVLVSGSSEGWTMSHWKTAGASGWGDAFQEQVAAHEAGHMLGLWDEYAGGATDPASGLINSGGLMHTLWGPTLDYYYDGFFVWLSDNLPIAWIPENGSVNPSEAMVASVPEPGSVMLLCIGLGFCAALRKVSRPAL